MDEFDPSKPAYHFTADPGHGWLCVARGELHRLGIANKVSSCSYQRRDQDGDFVFLEEDCDLPLFINAKKSIGEQCNIKFDYVDHTPIRDYQHYNKAEA